MPDPSMNMTQSMHTAMGPRSKSTLTSSRRGQRPLLHSSSKADPLCKDIFIHTKSLIPLSSACICIVITEFPI